MNITINLYSIQNFLWFILKRNMSPVPTKDMQIPPSPLRSGYLDIKGAENNDGRTISFLLICKELEIDFSECILSHQPGGGVSEIRGSKSVDFCVIILLQLRSEKTTTI